MGSTYHDEYFGLWLLLVTSLNDLQYAIGNLFRGMHVIHCSDTNHYNL